MPPQTLFVGRHVVFLPTCGSTNEVAHQLLFKNEATEGTFIYTDNQTAGRGQRGTVWEAAPGQNLTLSVLLKPSFLLLQQQYYLTICCALALADLLQPYVQEQIRVKWPNDIYAGDKKMAGVLIENTASGNSVQHSIFGIGLNVNQTRFGYRTATSLRQLTGRRHELTDIMYELAETLEKRYLQLRNGNLERLKIDYLQRLYRFQEWHPYRLEGRLVIGMITGIDETGRLALQVDNRLVYCNLKEVEFVLE